MFFAKRFDFDVHSRRQVELHQRVHGLLRGFKNIQQALVRTNLKLLARLFVHVRRTQHAILVFHRGQGNRSRDLRARALRGLDDLTRGLIQDAIVVSLQANTDSFFSNHFELSLTLPAVREERTGGKQQAAHFCYCTISLMVPAPTVCPPSRMAKRKPFSIATGVINSITRLTLSPGITISVAAGNSATPVTSVVRK